MTEFVCNWGKTPIIITIVVVLLILFVSLKLIALIKHYLNRGKNRLLILSFITLSFLPLVALVVTSCYLPLKVSVNNESIYIDQIKGGITIHTKTITEIRRYTAEDSKSTIRTFASGGLFGYLGKFKNPQIGDFQMYATDAENRILIRTGNEIYVISCNNPDMLIETVKR
jgi:hypothetical protein